ncbi:hypothetical protein DYB39_20915 [Providencia rettgeri]|uniref:hypothetical protein n=1 Tax=Providencia rettgeri TaxID=587 RepID=UPI000E3D2D3F|nr:hypothetical protein DYB39_20915 [Providencia rettgeri]
MVNIETILNESLKVERQQLNNYLKQYDLSAEDKVLVYEFHAENLRQNKNIIIKEEKINNYKSIADGVDYFHVFPKNLKKLIIEYGLTSNELLVIVEIIESTLSHGNLLINFSQKTLCKLLDMNKSTMSKVFKSLREKKVLIENENGHTYLNSLIFLKGLPHKLFIQYREHFLKSIDYKLNDDVDFDQVFDQDFIDQYELNLKKIKEKKKEIEGKRKEKSFKVFKNNLKNEVDNMDGNLNFLDEDNFKIFDDEIINKTA